VLDVGAVLTGMSNLEVARALLERGLEHVSAVAFLDEHDRKMALLRAGPWRVVRLNQCGLPAERVFTFFDQAHCTGMDIPQAPDAIAALTVGTSCLFRDVVQGAFRMRGIGRGQRIEILALPEVRRAVASEMLACRGAGRHGHGGGGAWDPAAYVADGALARGGPQLRAIFVRDLVRWLHLATIRAEKTQAVVLCVQNAGGAVSRRAVKGIVAWSRGNPGSGSKSAPPPDPRIVAMARVFNVIVDTTVSKEVDPRPVSLDSTVAAYAAYVPDDPVALAEIDAARGELRSLTAGGKR
jgi:hypothetical protein